MRGIFLVLSILVVNSVSVRAEILANVPEVCQAEFLENEKKINPSEYENMSFVSFDANHPDTVVLGGKVTRYFLTVLDQLPSHIRRIALEIPQGGDALASFLIADKIKQKGLDTYVGLAPCVSACTVLYQAGHERIAHPKASFGYHGPSGTGEKEESICSQKIRDLAIENVVNNGFDPNQSHLFQSNAKMTYVSGLNLVKFGIAHRLEALNIGSDVSIKNTNEAIHNFCSQNPHHDEC